MVNTDRGIGKQSKPSVNPHVKDATTLRDEIKALKTDKKAADSRIEQLLGQIVSLKKSHTEESERFTAALKRAEAAAILYAGQESESNSNERSCSSQIIELQELNQKLMLSLKEAQEQNQITIELEQEDERNLKSDDDILRAKDAQIHALLAELEVLGPGKASRESPPIFSAQGQESQNADSEKELANTTDPNPISDEQNKISTSPMKTKAEQEDELKLKSYDDTMSAKDARINALLAEIEVLKRREDLRKSSSIPSTQEHKSQNADSDKEAANTSDLNDVLEMFLLEVTANRRYRNLRCPSPQEDSQDSDAQYQDFYARHNILIEHLKTELMLATADSNHFSRLSEYHNTHLGKLEKDIREVSDKMSVVPNDLLNLVEKSKLHRKHMEASIQHEASCKNQIQEWRDETAAREANRDLDQVVDEQNKLIAALHTKIQSLRTQEEFDDLAGQHKESIEVMKAAWNEEVKKLKDEVAKISLEKGHYVKCIEEQEEAVREFMAKKPTTQKDLHFLIEISELYRKHLRERLTQAEKELKKADA